jgi:hypothetical protein
MSTRILRKLAGRNDFAVRSVGLSMTWAAGWSRNETIVVSFRGG